MRDCLGQTGGAGASLLSLAKAAIGLGQGAEEN